MFLVFFVVNKHTLPHTKENDYNHYMTQQGLQAHTLLKRFLLVAFLLLPICPAMSEDWPHWTGPYNVNIANEMGLPEYFDRSKNRNIKWTTRLGGVAFGCPTIAEGRVFVGTNMPALRDDERFRGMTGGVLLCLDEATGERLWALACPERNWDLPPDTFMREQWCGICSSPTVDGDRVYVITNSDDLLCLDVNGLRDGNDGTFQDEAQYMVGPDNTPIVLQDTDADILWRYDIPKELNVAPHDVGSCSVLVHGDVVYTSTSNGIGMFEKIDDPINAVNPNAPAFIAVDKYTGALLAVDDTEISQNLFHAQWASPSVGQVGDRDLIFLGGSDGFCYAFEAFNGESNITGKLRTVWKFDCNPPHYKQMPDGTPIEYGWGDYRDYERRAELNKSIAELNAARETPIEFHASLDKFNANDGSYIGLSEILTTPVFYNNRVYVATGRDPLHGFGRGALTCIDATGQGDITDTGLFWRFEEIGRSISTVAIAGTLVYAADLQGRLYCLDADTGELYWQHDTESETWASPIVADGKIYLNTEKAFLIFATGKEKTILSQSRGGTETCPAIANGTLYAFLRGDLCAITELGNAQEAKTGTVDLIAESSTSSSLKSLLVVIVFLVVGLVIVLIVVRHKINRRERYSNGRQK